ncbi:MAG: hypothetical protein JRN06_02220 [Nitrososphaerota archaeon]|nr:hypothetical protein [Nitrososphaerota archaeon]MDG7023329.1 hypothetical protein [Nitrososphaerota archaeon]
MTLQDNRRALSVAEGFDAIFEMVKAATERTLGLHRAGLTLVLADIPNDVGAYHEMGSNAIVMNRNILRIVERLSRSRSRRNSYVFMILLHEYLHTLGYTSDRQVRQLGRRIADEFLGKKHLAGEMTTHPLNQFFPDLEKLSIFRDKGEYQTVRRFDSSSTPYIR